jgi:thymidylate kinase
MLVTFSGMVGSGKTTNAKKTLRWLRARGHEPYYLRFRFINWRSLWRTPGSAPGREREGATNSNKRQTPLPTELQRRLETGNRLSFFIFLGYMLRIAQFRLFVLRHHRRDLLVVNRYFYDSFMHYRIASAREQKYLRWLIQAAPKPDLAILLVLRPETSHRRRPAYSLEELRQMAENTSKLQSYAPHLRVIATDNLSTVDRQVEKELAAVFINRKESTLVSVDDQ